MQEVTIDTVIKDFVSGIKAVEGTVVVGSVAYGMEKATSDIDLVVVSGNMQETLSSPILWKMDNASGVRNSKARLEQECDAHSFKGMFKERLFSPSIYSSASFAKIIGLQPQELKYMRNTPNKGIEVELFNFEGQSLSPRYVIQNEQLPSGHFLAWEPVCIYQDNDFYLGITPDALLKSPFIVAENNGLVNHGLQNLWDNVYNLLMKKQSSYEKKTRLLKETGRLPIIKNRDLPDRVHNYIKNQLHDAESRLRN